VKRPRLPPIPDLPTEALKAAKRIDQTNKRLDWLRRKRDKAVADYHFANGYRAGIEDALRAIEKGEDILGYSIDDGKAEIR
jgi:hypothetical protein